MEDFSKAGMFSFAEMMTNKGWINANTGGGYKAALKKVLGDLEDSTDVRSIDVKTQVLRYNNLNPGELSPASLKQYEKRVSLMIGYYISWKTDPTNFKPPQRELSDKSDKPAKAVKPTNGKPNAVLRKFPPAAEPNVGAALENERQLSAEGGIYTINGNAVKTPSLSMPFPLRDDFLVQITIPRDLSLDEAERLSTFIKALARA